MNSFVPKHKSYLKEKDLRYVPKKTKEEIDAALFKEKRKSAIDLMFDQVCKEQREVERDEKMIHSKIENGRKRTKNTIPLSNSTVIKAAQIFQTPEDEAAVQLLIHHAQENERIKQLENKAKVAVTRALKEVTVGNVVGGDIAEFINQVSDDDSDEGNPLNWIEVDRGLKKSNMWNDANVESLQ